ncbi:hypothetical protein NQ317_002810 [Molorchus minor]|uniref:Uncharacterized protein n=1 Tax=Molorchus minor TaxID=1323400 RepID=A0ABQ9JMJ9_9CUCU|nr:hypothetical protein NQ317_002810 [Molorchus minor]
MDQRTSNQNNQISDLSQPSYLTGNTDPYRSVPEYEVVPIHHVRRRSTPDYTENLIDSNDWLKRSKTPYENKILDSSENGLRLKAFGKPFSLTLIPTEGLLKKGKVEDMDNRA